MNLHLSQSVNANKSGYFKAHKSNLNFKSLLWWIYIYLSLWMPLDQKIEMYSKLQWSNVFKKEYVCTTEPMQDENDDEGSARTDRAVCFSLAAAMSSEVVWTLWWHKRPDLLEYGARYNLLEELRVTFWAPNFLSSRSLMSLMTIWPFHSIITDACILFLNVRNLVNLKNWAAMAKFQAFSGLLIMFPDQ